MEKLYLIRPRNTSSSIALQKFIHSPKMYVLSEEILNNRKGGFVDVKMLGRLNLSIFFETKPVKRSHSQKSQGVNIRLFLTNWEAGEFYILLIVY